MNRFVTVHRWINRLTDFREIKRKISFKKLSILPVFRVIGLSDSHKLPIDVDESLPSHFIFTD